MSRRTGRGWSHAVGRRVDLYRRSRCAGRGPPARSRAGTTGQTGRELGDFNATSPGHEADDRPGWGVRLSSERGRRLPRNSTVYVVGHTIQELV